jgi:hypothetical protein
VQLPAALLAFAPGQEFVRGHRLFGGRCHGRNLP